MNAARRPPRSSAERPAKASPAPARRPRQSIRQVASTWLAGIRFSGFSIIMMGVLVMAVVVLAPSIAEYAEQVVRTRKFPLPADLDLR